MSTAFANFLYRWRYAASAFIVLGALALAPRANITHIDNDLTAWFSRADPVYQDYERFRKEFGGTRTLIIAVQGDGLFTPAGLKFLRDATQGIEGLRTVQRVYSLATANVVRSAADEAIEVRPLLDDSEGTSPAQVRERALADPLIRGDLVSDDGRVSAIVVTFDEDRIDQVRAAVIEQIHQVIDARLPTGVRAYYNGSIEISETYNRITLANQQKFMPPIMAITLLAIYAMFRSLRRTLLAMFAIGISVLWTLGLYSLMGFTYNVLTSMIIPLIVVLAIADDVHMMQHYGEQQRGGASEEQAFTTTVSHLVAPLLGASATTALGMLSLATSNVVAVRAFGVGSAVGIMVDFAISLVFVPTMMGLLARETHEAPQERFFIEPLRRIARLSARHPGRVLAVSTVIAALASAGIVRLRIDTNHINFFASEHPLHQSADVIDTRLSGVYSFNLMLEGPPGSMKAPDTLRRMDGLAGEVARLPYVRKVTSLADYVKRMNRELNDTASLPTSADLIAQELFVFSLSEAGRTELDRVVASDYSRTHMSVKLASMSSDKVFEQVNEAERLAQAAFAGTGVRPTVTGSGRLFSTLDHYLVVSQISSFATAFVTVFAVIFLIFRSVRFGCLAIVPNVFPVLAILGVMGWLGISLNVATIMVASVALGVVDDDTIHFISRYRRDAARGLSTDDAIEAATIHEGRASLTTMLINTCGFAVLMMSEYRPSVWFGGMLALTMAVAFLAEVFIVPATIKLLPRFFAADRLRAPGVPSQWFAT